MKVRLCRSRDSSCRAWLVSLGGPFPFLGHLLRALGISGKSQAYGVFTYPSIYPSSIHSSIYPSSIYHPSIIYPLSLHPSTIPLSVHRPSIHPFVHSSSNCQVPTPC